MDGQNEVGAGLDRREALPSLVGDFRDFLIIAGLAGAGKDVGELTQEEANTFIFGGSMGGPTMTGLGLALARPDKRVLVITGDGDLLMALGSLATIGAMKPRNLVVICVDNELYGETGEQITHTGLGVSLDQVAEGCGFAVVRNVTNDQELADARGLLRESAGPTFINLKVNGGPPPAYRRNWHAEETKVAFRKALLGTR